MLPGWNSVEYTEKAHDRLELWGINCLSLVVAFDLFAWMFLRASRLISLLSIISLAALAVLEYVARRYGKRAHELSERDRIADKKSLEEAMDEQANAIDYLSGIETSLRKEFDEKLSPNYDPNDSGPD